MTILERKTSTRIALNNVLFATDFSASEETAVPYAVAACRRYDSTLHVALEDGYRCIASPSWPDMGRTAMRTVA